MRQIETTASDHFSIEDTSRKNMACDDAQGHVDQSENRANDDRQLVQRIQKSGCPECWDTFVNRFAPAIYRHCIRKNLQHADALELLQEVLLQILRSIDSFRFDPDKGRLLDWVIAITHSKLCLHWRKSARQRSLIAPQSVQHLNQSGSQANRRFADCSGNGNSDLLRNSALTVRRSEQLTEQLVKECLGRIKPSFQAETWRAFELIWFQHSDPREVARILDRPTSWVYVAKSRVLHRLVDSIQKQLDR